MNENTGLDSNKSVRWKTNNNMKIILLFRILVEIENAFLPKTLQKCPINMAFG